MIKTIAPLRKPDNYGSGHFGAPRGDREHNGIDFEAVPGSVVCSEASGTVTKIGYPYGDDLTYRYVEVTDSVGLKGRYFYLQPCVILGARVAKGDPLGAVQDLDRRYEGITQHFHFEVKTCDGHYLDPQIYLESEHQ